MKRSSRKQMNPSLLVWLVGAVVTGACVFGPAGAASEEGDVEQGLALARRICSGCHVVERNRPAVPAQQGPSFHAISNTPGMTSIALRAALQTSHRTMPNLMFEAQEMNDLSAYILSLKDR